MPFDMSIYQYREEFTEVIKHLIIIDMSMGHNFLFSYSTSGNSMNLPFSKLYEYLFLFIINLFLNHSLILIL